MKTLIVLREAALASPSIVESFGLTVLLAICASQLEASSISVNFHTGNDANARADHELASGETAGFVPVDGQFWNNIDVGNAGAHNSPETIFASAALKDDAGTPNAATISASPNSTYFIGYAASAATGGSGAQEIGLSGNHDDLFNSYLGLNGPSGDGSPADAAVLAVSGLGPAYTGEGYSLILYSDTDKGPVSGVRRSVFTVTPAGGSPVSVFTEDDSAAPGSNTFDGTYVLSDGSDTGADYANYVVIEGLTAAGFTLEITSPDGGRGGLSGFQIITGGPAQGPVINAFNADDTYVGPGDPVTLTWDVENATTLTLDPGAIDVTGTTSRVVNPAATTTYTLSASDGGAPVQATVEVRVGPPRPNILIFLVDDMGVTDTSVPFAYDGSGNPVSTTFNNFHVTPHMETLAGRGMKFTQAYATPVCSSTRASIMTGFNTTRHGVISQVNTGGVDPNRVSPTTTSHCPPNDWKRTGMQADDVTMPMLLGDAGYRTIHAGKAHFGAFGYYAELPTAIGFDQNFGGTAIGAPSTYTGNFGNLPNMDPWENTGTFLTDALTQAMNGAIEDAVDDGVPFFAYMSHYAVHSPFTTDPNATGDYSSAVNSSHQKFATMIEGMDLSLGSILAKLDELGVAEETLVIFLGDNGSDSPATTPNGLASGAFSDFPQRGKKGSAWEGGIHVPMIVSWAKPDPANPLQAALPIPQGSREDDLVVVWDILPTVLNVTGTTPPHAFDGYDLTPYLNATSGTHRPQEMLMYLPIDHRNDFFSLYRDENWKLIYRFASDTFELYDLDSDPTESSDLAAADPGRTMRMARAMAEEFDRTWGIQGVLWPTFCGASRPYPDDPFIMPTLPTVDTDQDGLSDNTEDPDSNGLVDPGETDPENEDSDRDALSDGDELRTGTDPLDASSFFKLNFELLSATELLLTWPSAPGATYRIEDSTGLVSWDPVLDLIPAADPGTSTSRTVTVPANTPRYFLRSVLLP